MATLPAPPTNVVAAPSAATIIRSAPATPLIVIDGSTVPVILPFIRASFGGSGASAASYTSTGLVTALGGATGVLSAAMTVQQQLAAASSGTGALGCGLAFGTGAIPVVSAQFAATGAAAATDAAYGCTAALSVLANVVSAPVSAAFGGNGLLATQWTPPPNINFAATGTGALSATTGVVAGYGTTGALAASLWAPSGMILNGNQPGPNNGNWVQIGGWTANTTTYPGSVVNSNALVAQGTKRNATVAVTISFTSGNSVFGSQISVRIKQNGNPNPIATSNNSTASPAATSAVGVLVSNNDTFTVEIQDTQSYNSLYQATLTSGALTIT
ncbi:hypothetical protein ACIP5Y_15570 [Nocardia sp. NPDC088792]|uniref:hypothetical protein n=1 Tax=Nocardia sp. NPDC088792 TaxID=3364332 RepID=UPI00381DA890